MITTLLFLATSTTLIGSPLSSKAAGVEVSPSATSLRYVGRWEKKPASARCSWPAATVVLVTDASTVNAKFEEAGYFNRWQVEIDGTPTSVIKLLPAQKVYPVATGLRPGKHTIRLVKRTEAFSGPSDFRGFELNSGARIFPAPKLKRRIEIIGDSISAGFGIEGKEANEKYSYETANAYLTYGQVAGRALNAGATDIAWSGKKMWPDNTIPSIYHLVIPTEPKSVWTPTKGQDNDVIVINLATNDFGQKVPEEAGWTNAYIAFVKQVRSENPRAMIYLASGPMMSDNFPPNAKALTTLNTYLAKISRTFGPQDRKIKVLEFETQNGQRDGIGSAWHPNVKTNQNMANRLVAAIKRDLKW